MLVIFYLRKMSGSGELELSETKAITAEESNASETQEINPTSMVPDCVSALNIVTVSATGCVRFDEQLL